MKKHKYLIIFSGALFALILTACSPSSATPTTQPATITVETKDQTGVESGAASTNDTTPQPAAGDASLTWRTEEVGEGIKPAFAIDEALLA